jgi:hypothetical protein
VVRPLGVLLILVATMALTAACDGKPAFVYVLMSPQTVEVAASASATKILRGRSAVLHATRRTAGQWRRIPRSELRPDQCWMQQIPPQSEDEVADNLHWSVAPAGPARFNLDFRSDHTRLVILPDAGEFTLTPTSGVWCEPGRSVTGSAIRIEVSGE